MEFVKFKFVLILFLIGTSCRGSDLPTPILNPEGFFLYLQENAVADVIIVMEDDVMRIDTGDPNVFIDVVDFFDQEGESVFQVSCHTQSKCLIDLNDLGQGNYQVIVNTSNGETYSAVITIM